MAFCKIMFIGNLGRDPEMRYTPNGKPVTQFSVAVSHSKPDGQGGWVDEGTDWYRVSVFGDRAERAAAKAADYSQAGARAAWLAPDGQSMSAAYEAAAAIERVAHAPAEALQCPQRRRPGPRRSMRRRVTRPPCAATSK